MTLFRVETLYRHSRDTLESEWRHSEIRVEELHRVEILYIQNVDSVSSEWIYYTE